jgi:hypothetical protein
MSTKATAGFESGDDDGRDEQDPQLTEARYCRALTESMSVTFTGPGIADVHSASGETYRVELESGHCGCADTKFRGLGCKHAQRAAIESLFLADQPRTRFVALVARFAREHGCEHGDAECAGPTTPSTRPASHPCPGCVASTGGDDWAVYQRLGALVRGQEAR